MGRRSTGLITTGEALRIELSYLIKQGFIKKDKNLSGILTWTNGSSISFESNYSSSDNIYLRLVYTNTSYDNEVTKHDYKIKLIEFASNLGKGKVLYFVCPQSGKYCRILYKCYGSLIWKSRFAYKIRIYYQSQLSSKLNMYNDKFWTLENKLAKLSKKRKQSFYNGNRTRFSLRIERLKNQYYYYDDLRWIILDKRLRYN
jgi:hypothetical protein